MSYLIDTQALIWFVEGNDQLSQKARPIIEDTSVSVYTSIASIWEMGIKISIGKLKLSLPFQAFVTQLQKDKIDILNVQPEHVFEIFALPHFHKDPFDRIIIAQAMVEGLDVITSDAAFRNYPVAVLW